MITSSAMQLLDLSSPQLTYLVSLFKLNNGMAGPILFSHIVSMSNFKTNISFIWGWYLWNNIEWTNHILKKSLKILKWHSETVNRWKTGNTMAKRKQTTRQTNNDLQNTTQKTKDRAPRTPQKTRGELKYSGKVNVLLYAYM